MTDGPEDQQPTPQAPRPAEGQSGVQSPAIPPNVTIQLNPALVAQMAAAQAPSGVPLGFPFGARAPGMPIIIGTQAQQMTWQGPFPPPEAVERYDRVQPGAFDRILSMAERMQEAQIKQSADALRYQHSDAKRGQILGTVVCGGALLGAVVVGLLGSPWLAGVFLAVPVMGVAKALVDSRVPQPDAGSPEATPSTPDNAERAGRAPDADSGHED